MWVGSPEDTRNGDCARRGSPALELVQRLAETIASAEIRLELQLQKVLVDITAAEDLGAALTERAVLAEGRANEAENWLSRLHAKLEEVFRSAKRVSTRAQV